MLNYLCTIVLLLMGKEMRRSNLTVHLTIRNIFDLLTESANSNILKITPPRPFGVSPSYPKRGQVENKSACSGGTGDLMKAFDNQGAGGEAPTDFVTLRATLTRLLPLLALFGVFMSTTGQLMPGCGGGGSGATALESTAVDGSEGGSVDADDIGDSAVMPPVGINAPMATLPDYGTSSTYTSSTNTEGMTTVADTGAGVGTEQDGQYVAGTTDETVVMRIDSIVQERLAHRGFGKNRWNVIARSPENFSRDDKAIQVNLDLDRHATRKLVARDDGVTRWSFATMTASFFSREAIADDVANACDEAGVSYVQVHTGQPFTLLVPGNNDSTVRLKFTDCDTLWSENWVEETVNTKSVHTGNAAFDVTPGPRKSGAAAAVAAVLEESTSNLIYTLAGTSTSSDSENIGQKILEADGIFAMSGASSTDYQATGIDATSALALAYHKDQSYLSLRELTGGVDVNRSWYDTGNEVWRLSALGTATVDADEYVALKYQNEGLWFVTDPSASEDKGRIYNAMDVIGAIDTNEIFYHKGLSDTDAPTLKKGRTFAVDSNSLGFAVFEVTPTADTNSDGTVDSNDTGDLWLRMANTSGPLAGAKISLPAQASTPVIEDIVVVKNQDYSVSGDTGIVYLLDSANDRIHVVSYSYIADLTPPYDDPVYSITTTFTASDSITVGDNPKSIVVNSDGTRVYVLNTTDATLSVVKTSNKKVVATVDLVTTVYPGKTLTLSPTKMGFQPKTVTSGVDSTNGYLLVTDSILKTVMVVDTDNITESSGLQVVPAVFDAGAAIRSLRR